MVNYVIAAVMSAAGVALLVMGIRKYQIRAKILGTPTLLIGSLKVGANALVRGRVSCDTPLAMPDTGNPCVYYSYEIHEEVREESSNDNSMLGLLSVLGGVTVAVFKLKAEH